LIPPPYAEFFFGCSHLRSHFVFDNKGLFAKQHLDEFLKSPFDITLINTLHKIIKEKTQLKSFEEVHADAKLLASKPYTIWDQKGGYKNMVNDFILNQNDKDYRIIVLQTEDEFREGLQRYIRFLSNHGLGSELENARSMQTQLGSYYLQDRAWYLPDNEEFKPQLDPETGSYDITNAISFFNKKLESRRTKSDPLEHRFVVVSDWRQLSWDQSLARMIRFIINVNLFQIGINGRIKIMTFAARQA
jgi:hypothetical protein